MAEEQAAPSARFCPGCGKETVLSKGMRRGHYLCGCPKCQAVFLHDDYPGELVAVHEGEGWLVQLDRVIEDCERHKAMMDSDAHSDPRWATF
jgi:hypothetical protein